MILITGAAGFIGANLVRELNSRGQKNLILVDRMGSDGKWKNLRGTQFHQFIQADQLFEGLYEELLEEVKVIYHLGACSSTTEKDMDFLMSNNVHYSQILFEFAEELNIPFIYASSAATYGDGEFGYDDNHDLVDQLLPLNPYGFSKQIFDQWVLQKAMMRQTPPIWFGVKFFNVYGPHEFHKGEMRSIALKAFEQIQTKGEVNLFKSHRDDYQDGLQLRDFVYVKDCCKALIELSKLKKGRGLVNMGTGKANSFKSMVENCFNALDKEAKINYIDMPESIRNQYQYFTEAKMDRFNRLCPKFEFSSLEEGITDYMKFLQSEHC